MMKTSAGYKGSQKKHHYHGQWSMSVSILDLRTKAIIIIYFSLNPRELLMVGSKG